MVMTMPKSVTNDVPENFGCFGDVFLWNEMTMRIECDLTLAPGMSQGVGPTDQV